MITRRRISGRCLGITLCLASLPLSSTFAQVMRSASGGEVRALIVGIDNYVGQNKLSGAQADANDLQQSLSKMGVSNIRRIDEKAATRAEIIRAMETLIAESKAGDLVVLTFAGHGFQVKEAVPGSKPNGKDEAYVLTFFSSKPDAGNRKMGPNEFIRGPEIKAWLKRLDDKSVDVLFVADTCHSGGLTRKPERRDKTLTYRSGVNDIEDPVAKTFAKPVDSLRTVNDFKNVTFLAAVNSENKSPEIPIAGKPRGALSYSVSRAIEGAALGNQTGPVTRQMLFKYARQQVRNHTNTAQTIETEPKVATERVIFKMVPAGEAKPAPALVSSQTVATSDPLRVAVLNGDTATLAKVEPYFTPFLASTDVSAADLTWDAAKRDVLIQGDILARGIDAKDIPSVVDRVAAARLLTRMAETRSQDFRLLPDNKVQKEGTAVGLEADDVAGKSIIAFNINGDGLIETIFPIPENASDNAQIKQGTWSIKDIVVGSPFGADLVVLIVSDHRLPDLEAAIRAKNKTRAAGSIPALLQNYMEKDKSIRLGLTTIVTEPISDGVKP